MLRMYTAECIVLNFSQNTLAWNFSLIHQSHAGVSYVAVIPSFSESDEPHPEKSIFTAEAYVLWSAVKHTIKINLRKAVIFADSLSIVKALISARKHKNTVPNELYPVLCTAYTSNQHVTIC